MKVILTNLPKYSEHLCKVLYTYSEEEVATEIHIPIQTWIQKTMICLHILLYSIYSQFRADIYQFSKVLGNLVSSGYNQGGGLVKGLRASRSKI